MQDEGEYCREELPAIELEIDDDFSIASSSDRGSRAHGPLSVCSCRRKCFLVSFLLLVGVAALGVGLGTRGGSLRRSPVTDSLESKAGAAEGSAIESSPETTNATISPLQGSTLAPSAVTSPPASSPEPKPTSSPVAAPPPFTLPPSSDSPIALTIWVSTGTPSIGTVLDPPTNSPATQAPRVVFNPVPSTSAPIAFPTKAPTSQSPTNPALSTSSSFIPLNPGAQPGPPVGAASAPKTSWPELVGTGALYAVEIIKSERSDVYIVPLISGFDRPPSGFDAQRVVVYRTVNGIVDRAPTAG